MNSPINKKQNLRVKSKHPNNFVKKMLKTSIGCLFLASISWLLLGIAVRRMFDGTRVYNIPIPSYSPAIVSIEQTNDSLMVTLPDSSVTIEMVYVPAGIFYMGSEIEGPSHFYKPVHEVFLDAYWIDRTEVTNAQFSVFVQETGYQTTAEREGGGRVSANNLSEVESANWRHPQGGDIDIKDLANHPTVQVSWYDAIAYCLWRSSRLPTEAEWEKAARGIDERIYSWGNQITGSELNYCDSSCPFYKNIIEFDDDYSTTAPVGSFLQGVSPYGTVDMVGNVAEYTADWFDFGYYAESPIQNPKGPSIETIEAPNIFNHRTGGWKAIRGGSWASSSPIGLTTYFRDQSDPRNRWDGGGFRCADDTP